MFTTTAPAAESDNDLTCMASWTNDEITVGIVSLGTRSGTDPRLVLEESLVHVVRSLESFDPESSIEFVPG